MKLLLDQNLSYRLVKGLSDSFPGTVHADSIGLEDCSDRKIWRYAKQKGFAIVTQDADFYEFGLYDPSPALVIWLRCGNQPNQDILALLESQKKAMDQIVESTDNWCLEIK